MSHQLKIFHLLILLFIISVIAIWSSQLFTEWDVDYGVYYVGSNFLDDNFQLYKDFFTHKGPLYYLFLKTIGYFIGWGKWQAYFSIILTMFVFYIPIFFILLFERVSLSKFTLGILLSVCLLYNQNTNSCISFFQSGFLITSFWLLIKRDEIFTLNVSFFLLVCAILSRIDGIIYLPVYLFILFYGNHFNNFKDYFKILFTWSIILSVSFFTLMFIFDFNFNQYYINNFKFNNWYKNAIVADSNLFYQIAKYIVRPSSYDILTGSILIIPLLIIFPKLFSNFKEINLIIKNIFRKSKITNSISSNTRAILILILSFIGWFLTISDKDYHFIMVLLPILIVIFLNLNSLNFKQCILVIVISLYCILTITYLPIHKLLKDPECLFSVHCKGSYLSEYSESINFMKEITDNEIAIVGHVPWVYFFSGKRPKGSLNNYWFYFLEKPFVSEILLKEHKDLLKMPKGKIFLIENKFLDLNFRNKFMQEILANSLLLDRLDKFSIHQIR
ncbi:hypothetical protein N9S61_01845 [Alphaproteobacteria bacterium]|nr:hypothetical protein [Alphaproteobacteria bacterium]